MTLQDPYSQQYYKQFRGDLETQGKYRVGFQYDKSHLSTVYLEAPGRRLTSELEDHLIPPLHTELKELLREAYDVKTDEELCNKNIIVEIRPTGYTINMTKKLHGDLVDEIVPLEVNDTLARKIYNFTITLLKYHGAFEAAVINVAYTIGDHLLRKERDGKQIEGYQ
jgi:hypothetical protein